MEWICNTGWFFEQALQYEEKTIMQVWVVQCLGGQHHIKLKLDVFLSLCQADSGEDHTKMARTLNNTQSPANNLTRLGSNTPFNLRLGTVTARSTSVFCAHAYISLNLQNQPPAYIRSTKHTERHTTHASNIRSPETQPQEHRLAVRQYQVIRVHIPTAHKV